MRMSLKAQKIVTLTMFLMGVALILYPLLNGAQLSRSGMSDELLAKPTASPEDHPLFTEEAPASESESLDLEN